MIQKTPGIYKWENLVTGRVYVGQTNNLHRRHGEEKSQLRNNRFGINNRYLQASWNKHGEANFQYSVLETIVCDVVADKSYITSREQWWYDFYGALSGGLYNQAGPVDAPNRGVESHKKGKRVNMSDEERLVRATRIKALWKNESFREGVIARNKSRAGTPMLSNAYQKMMAAIPRGENHPNFGRSLPRHVIEASNIARRVKIKVTDMMTDTFEVYVGWQAVIESIGISRPQLKRRLAACKVGKEKKFKNFKIEYAK